MTPIKPTNDECQPLKPDEYDEDDEDLRNHIKNQKL
jgi:hypothetical protein